MSNVCGVCGVFGVLLNGPLAEEMREWVDKEMEKTDDCLEYVVIHSEEWADRFRSELGGQGIVVPDDAQIEWTGFARERPGRCNAPPESFVIGFGILTHPVDWVDKHNADKWDASWTQAASMHTWVWKGWDSSEAN